MKTLRVDAQSSEPGKPEQFTGTVWNEIIAIAEPPSRLHVARVTFAPASRTAWHTHPLGQILLAVSGIGRSHWDWGRLDFRASTREACGRSRHFDNIECEQSRNLAIARSR